MATGTYTDNVTIPASGATGSPKSTPVTLTVTAAAAPTLSVSPSLLSFSYQQGGSAPASQPIMVSSSSGAQLAYTVATSGGAWLSEIGRASCRGKSVDLGGRRIIKKKTCTQ